MKILLTGALGYIGTETLFRFAQQPTVTVYAVDNDAEAICTRGAHFMRYPNIKIINCDVTNSEQVKQLPAADLIVHLAAKVGYLSSSQNPNLTQSINVNGVENIASLNIPIIFFSTGSVYGQIGELCDETVDPNPQTIYAETKYRGEQIVKQLEHVIFRPATAYGLSLKTRHDLIVHNLIHQAVKTRRLEIYQPEARRSFYSVQKLAELIEFVCNNYASFKNNTYNVGCESGNITKQQLLTLLKEQINFDCIKIVGADADTRDYNVSYNKLKTVWPNYNESFADKIPSIVEYYKQWLQ
jgi:nucleoside-diphosphate-sugar epimerase